MSSKKRKRTDFPTQVCVVHFKGQESDSFTYFKNCKSPQNRLEKLQQISRQRMSQPASSPYRMEEACKCVPDELLPEHGYHRECYQRFTKNLNRLKASEEESVAQPRTSGRASGSGDKIIFKKDCIFCNREGLKKIKVNGVWTTEDTRQFDREGGTTVQAVAKEKNDEKLLQRIRGFDLFACEAQYHPSCRKDYVRDPTVWRSTNEAARKKQEDLERSHKEAFQCVCEIVEREIIQKQNIMKLSDLCDIYITALNATEHANQDYRAEKLKKKLQREEQFTQRLSFTQPQVSGKFASLLVYSSEMANDRAVILAYQLGSADVVKDVALNLRNIITVAFKNSDSLPWPPTDEFLKQHDVLPSELKTFLNYLLSGEAEGRTAKVQRLASSLGQDLCRAVTKGQWKLPKHVLLCMTLRHLFRSEQLTTLLNRFGHCDTYRFTLELETAIAQAMEECSNILSSEIVLNPQEPALFHSEFDNFDMFISTLEGQSSVHTAHGIMMQEVSEEGHCGTRLQLPSVERTRGQSLEINQEELPECYVTVRKSPSYSCTESSILGGQEAMEKAHRISLLWLLCRLHSALQEDQDVPGWAGFMSLLGEKPDKKTAIGYYPVINEPITEYKTVQECLRQAEEATRNVGQEYVVTTFDLGVCMKAYPITWNQPQKYKQHVILMGTFHTVCAYFKMIGKKMDGTGLADIMQEAGLITSGSVNGVMSGKNYDRALHCHKVVLECLERLLLKKFMAIKGTDSSIPTFQEATDKLLTSAKGASSASSIQQLLVDEVMKDFFSDYEQFRDDVRQGKHGKTPQFWISYMDHVWLVLDLLRGVKHNDFELYGHTLLAMPDLFFSFGGQNYARYLTFFSTFLANLETTHPGATDLLRRGAFSVARSFIPGNRCAVDKTMEETFQKHAKSRGGTAAGITGVATNYKTYQRWVRTTSERIKYLQLTLDLADMARYSETDTQHHDLRPSQVLKSEDSVDRAMRAVESFTNPFAIDEPDKLVVLSSGSTVPKDIEQDVLRAETAGKAEKEKFITQRLKAKDHFFDPIKKLRLKTMANMSKKVKLRSTENKVTEFRHQGNIAFQMLVKSEEGELGLDLHELMSFQLTPVPYSLATADNFMTKTDKSTGFHRLTKDLEDADCPPDKETLTVIDGNAVFHSMTQVPIPFRQICLNVFDMMPKNTDFVFSTDMYQEGSIKSMERKRRGTSDKIILSGENTKRPGDWAQFLVNDENKSQFVNLLLQVWSQDSQAAKLVGRNVVLVCEGKAYQLTSADGVKTGKETLHDLTSTQEETDSRVVLYCKYGQQKGYKYIRVKSPDSDVFFILLQYALQLEGVTVLFDTGKGNKKRLLDVTALAGELTQKYCSALLSLHAFSGCDTTSAFKGKGKVKPLKTMLEKPKFVDTFAELGETWEVRDERLNELEDFTCAIYGRQRFHKVDDLRYHLLKEKCKDEKISAKLNIDLAAFPPCRRSLKQHAFRANYQAAIWKRAHEPLPVIPNPSEGHGWVLSDGILEPLWTEEEEELVLPQAAIDSLLDDLPDDEDEESMLENDESLVSDDSEDD